jgi:hypothetical protein
MGTRIKKIDFSKVWLNYENIDDYQFEAHEELFFRMRDEMTALLIKELKRLKIELSEKRLNLIVKKLSESQSPYNWNDNFCELEFWARDNKIEIEIF